MKQTAKIRSWLFMHQIVFCQICGRVLFYKTARWNQLTTGEYVPLCDTCDRQLFSAFEDESK